MSFRRSSWTSLALPSAVLPLPASCFSSSRRTGAGIGIGASRADDERPLGPSDEEDPCLGTGGFDEERPRLLLLLLCAPLPVSASRTAAALEGRLLPERPRDCARCSEAALYGSGRSPPARECARDALDARGAADEEDGLSLDLSLAV